MTQQKTISVTPAVRKQYKQELLQVGDGQVGRELFHLIKSRYRIIYIRSPEEDRVIRTFQLIAMSEGYDLCQWDFSRGLLDAFSRTPTAPKDSEVHESPEALLHHIIDQAKADNAQINKQNKQKGKQNPTGGHIHLLLDFHHFLEGAPTIERLFKEFSSFSSVSHIVIVSPVFVCPPTLEKEFTLIDFPPPSRSEVKVSFDRICTNIPMNFPQALKSARDSEEEILAATTGLTITESENAYAKSLVKTKTFDISTILDEKKQIIRKGGILEYRDSRFNFDQVGGLDVLKGWLDQRRLAFGEDAKSYGLDPPKGVLLVGIPGTGKSMISDAIGTHYEMPLLRLDIGALFSAHIGESEENARLAIQTASAIAPCVLWIDEVEKGIGGVQSSNATDGGVTNRVFGTLLTWMSEKTQSVFVVCTANNLDSIPPEFQRAGRFDEIFFLDLPDEEQRMEVISVLLQRKGRDSGDFDLHQISLASQNYSPAEIEKGINNAMFVAFADQQRDLQTDDIVSELGKFQPLYNSRREEIERMRIWAVGEDGSGGRACLANSVKDSQKYATKEIGRQLDLSEDDV